MPRTLYLHIGAHRTATTSIQSFLFNNFRPLLDRGVFYPFRVRRHLGLMNELFSGAKSVDEVARDIEARSASKDQEVHTIVLSDEDVCMRRDLSVLAGFRDHFDVRVVFALRRQDSWLESWYLQNIKWQWQDGLSHCTFPEFMAQRDRFHWIEYDAYLTHVETVFGAGNVRPYVFEKEQMPDGPVAQFCRTIGLTDLDGLTDPPHVNSSRSPEMAEFMRHLPLDQASVQVRNILVRACEAVDRKVLGNTGKQSELMMSPQERRATMDHYGPGNRAVARRYFGRDELFLAPLPAEDTPRAQLRLPEDPQVVMSRLVAPFLSELIGQDVIAPKPKT